MEVKCSEVISKQLEQRKVKRDADVKELYLGEHDLSAVDDLSRFKNLTFLWLNGNKLRQINCVSQNFRLSELYLQNNELITVTGALSHLTSMVTLSLNNNQLQHLEKVINELVKMQKLHTLNLFNNPIAQEAEYRHYVLHRIPSIQLLDRREVLKSEKDMSRKMYEGKETEMRDGIAFGRRSDGPPSLYYPGGQPPRPTTKPADFEVGNNFYRNNPPYATEEQAIKMRALRRSVMEYTSFDWRKVPSSLEQRTAEKPFENPQIITTRFR